MNKQEVLEKIAAFRAITGREEITPDSLGAILDQVLDVIPENISAVSEANNSLILDAKTVYSAFFRAGLSGLLSKISFDVNESDLKITQRAFNFIEGRGQDLQSDFINAASAEKAGLMSKSDKVALTNLVESVTKILEDLKAVVKKDDLTDIKADAVLKAFIQLWDKKCFRGGVQMGKYDIENAPDKSKPFVLCDMWLSFEQALDTYAADCWHSADEANTFYLGNKSIVTNIPPYRSVPLHGTFYGCSNLIKANIGSDSTNQVSDATYSSFHLCSSLEEINGLIQYTGTRASLNFNDCRNLKIAKIKVSSGSNLYIPQCEKFSLESFNYTVQNSNDCTITVHQDIYSKLTSGPQEWQQLLIDAAAKNISFATI